MKNKKIMVIVIIILVILLTPIPLRLKDGGSIQFKSFVYEVTKIHELSPEGCTKPYIEGIEIKIFGKTLYRETNE